MPPSDRYKDKYFSILGDSISTLEGYNPPEYDVFYDWTHKRQAGIFTPEDTWWGQVIETLDGRRLMNNSFSGSLVCKLPRYVVETYGCSDERTSRLGFSSLHPDVIMILMGYNDWGNGRPIHPTEKDSGLAVFTIAYETMLEKIKRNYPKAEIWCLTLPRSYRSETPDLIIPYCYSGVHIEDYCNAIKACGEKYGCKVIDIYHPENPYDTIDGYHPTAEGMTTIANAILRELEKEMHRYDH